MDFVDGDRGVEGLALGPFGEPIAVAPGVAFQVGHYGGGVGAQFSVEAVGVGLLGFIALEAGFYVIFIGFAFGEVGDENLPDALRWVEAHGIYPVVPIVEVAYDADALGVGGPDGEMHAAHA